MDAVMLLKFDEEPCYGAYRTLFEPVTGDAAARPIQLLSLPRPASSAKARCAPGPLLGKHPS